MNRHTSIYLCVHETCTSTFKIQTIHIYCAQRYCTSFDTASIHLSIYNNIHKQIKKQNKTNKIHKQYRHKSYVYAAL